MNMEPMQQENQELKARLHAFAAILRLGRDAFAAADLTAAGVHIVNNSKTLLAYSRSVLVDLRGNPRILAEFAQPEVNQHTAYAQAILRLSREIAIGDGPQEVSADTPPQGKLSARGEAAWHELTEEGRRLMIVPLRASSVPLSAKEPFLWILEYPEAVPQHVSATLALLSSDYGGALWLNTPRKGGGFGRWLRKITAMRIFLLLVLAFLISLFVVNVEHTVSAEFVIRPKAVFSSYAWFDCVVKKCAVQDGDTVKKGDVILHYDTDRMRFQLAAAQAAFQESNAEYEQETKASFTDRERLGRLKILALKREQAKIAIDEAKWYLAHSQVRAEVPGVVTLPEGSADKLEGRALRQGEKQFDILSGSGMIAEIMVNEKDASVLENPPKVLLFLHTRPELPIQVKIISERFYPELTEQNIYSYNLKAEMVGQVPDLRYGMRGVARVTGQKVKLGYYLFRSLVL